MRKKENPGYFSDTAREIPFAIVAQIVAQLNGRLQSDQHRGSSVEPVDYLNAKAKIASPHVVLT
jgi:hypothetical protein